MVATTATHLSDYQQGGAMRPLIESSLVVRYIAVVTESLALLARNAKQQKTLISRKV